MEIFNIWVTDADGNSLETVLTNSKESSAIFWKREFSADQKEIKIDLKRHRKDILGDSISTATSLQEGKSSDLSLGTLTHQHRIILAKDHCTSQIEIWMGQGAAPGSRVSRDPARKNSRGLSGGRVWSKNGLSTVFKQGYTQNDPTLQYLAVTLNGCFISEKKGTLQV